MLDATDQPPHRALSATAQDLIAAASTLLAALVGLRLQDAGIAVFWPAAGIGAGLMLLAPGNQRRHVAAGILAALATANLLQQRPVVAGLVFMAGNLAECYIVASVLERAGQGRFATDSIGRAAWLVLVAVVVPAFIAVATAIGFEIAGYGQAGLGTRWWLWLSSHATGILTVMPAVLAVGSSRSGRWLTAEDAGQLVIAASASFVLIGGLLPESSSALLIATLLIVPLALWVLIDAGPRRAALALLAVSLVTIWQTSSQAGLFSGDVSRAQLFLLAASLLLLGLGAWPRRPEGWLQGIHIPRMTELQAAMVLVPAVFLASVGWWTWSSIEAAAIAKVERLSSFLAVHAEHVLDAQRTIADAALAHVAGREVAGLANDRSVHVFLSRLAQTSATPSAISLIDVASGRAVADSTDFPPREFDFSNRDYVRAARAASYDTFISGVMPRFPTGSLGFTVSSVTLDQRLLAVTRPELKELLDLVGTLREHQNDVVNIVREDGAILARQPWPASAPAVPQNSFTMRLLRKEISGTSLQTSAIDGRQRMVAMRRAGPFPVYAIYGLDYARVRGEWLRQLAPLGVFSIIASLFLVLLAGRAQRAEVSAATARIETDAQRRLRKSEERFRLLVEQSADGIFVSDAQGRYIEVNPAGCDMLGYTREEILERTIADVVMPEEGARVPVETGRLAGGAVMKSEWRFRRKDGSGFIGEVVARQLPDGRLQAILRDITERHEAEMRLRDSEERLRAIVDTAADSIVVIDEGGAIQSVNPATERMFGHAQDELVGRNISVLMPEHMPAGPDDCIALLRSTGAGKTVGAGREIKGRRKDGSSFDADLAVAEWHASGRRYFTGIMRDITERKRDEAKIQHLLTELNHRAKNLLGVVQAIAFQTASSSPQAFMESFSERLEGLAASQDLLVESRWHGIEIEALARAQLSHFANLIGERIVLCGPKVNIQAAAAQTIGMALHELATNAGKYGALSNASGRVRIEWTISSVAGKGQALQLGWCESGGPPVTPPLRRGFGTTIIDSMPRMSLDAEVRLEYPPSGLSWTMICPAASVVEQPGDDNPGVREST